MKPAANLAGEKKQGVEVEDGQKAGERKRRR
jgi:hypothetical protein